MPEPRSVDEILADIAKVLADGQLCPAPLYAELRAAEQAAATPPKEETA